MVKVEVSGIEIYLDQNIKNKLDNINKIRKKGYDCIIILDGDERTGKSTLALTIAWYLSGGNLTVNNIAIDNPDLIKKLKEFPDESIIIPDEAVLMFSSTDVMKKESKNLKKIMNIIGMKRMVLILNIPSFFDLNKEIAVRRSRFLLHVYTDKEMNRGRVAYYGTKKKKLLYLLGKKSFESYAKPRPDFLARFTDFKPSWWDDYLKVKEKTLFTALDDAMASKPKIDRKVIEGEVITKVSEYDPKRITIEEWAKILNCTKRTINTKKKVYKETKDEE